MWIKTKQIDGVELYFVTNIFLAEAGNKKYVVKADAPSLNRYLELAKFEKFEEAEAYLEKLAKKLNAEEVD